MGAALYNERVDDRQGFSVLLLMIACAFQLRSLPNFSPTATSLTRRSDGFSDSEPLRNSNCSRAPSFVQHATIPPSPHQSADSAIQYSGSAAPSTRRTSIETARPCLAPRSRSPCHRMWATAAAAMFRTVSTTYTTTSPRCESLTQLLLLQSLALYAKAPAT